MRPNARFVSSASDSSDHLTRRLNSLTVTVIYAVMTVAFTWPITRGIGHDVPGDLGDPLLNIWILAWDVTHALSGRWWNAPIFYPHQLALAYSEHLLAQAIQIAPLYALTHNPILCYNVLFLSTFVLSGLGMFLFTRELTGDPVVALAGGAAYAFAPYRIGSLPHLQVLSSAWMPFVLFGFRRYFSTARLLPLVFAGVCWLAQNLSCGYYALFFSPVAVLYCVWELTVNARAERGRARLLVPVSLTIAAVVAGTLPFALPYLQLRHQGFGPRSMLETSRYSADVYAYFTADPNVHLWGTFARAWAKPEGALFPGLITAGLALTAVIASVVAAIRKPTLIVGAFATAGVLVALLLGFSIRVPPVKIASLSRAVAVVSGFGMLLILFSRTCREAAERWWRSPAAILAVMSGFAMAMSWGPAVYAKGRLVAQMGPYAWFYNHVPGYNGVRAPARFGMIVALSFAALASLALAAIRTTRMRTIAAIAVTALVAMESCAVPIPVNQISVEYQKRGLAPLPPLSTTRESLYDFIATTPSAVAVLELPLGEPAYDVRYMFHSIGRWKPLVNGYSGGYPSSYEPLDSALDDISGQPERAWRALVESGATHAIVHEDLYAADRGPTVSGWLRARAGREIATFGPDHVFRVK